LLKQIAAFFKFKDEEYTYKQQLKIDQLNQQLKQKEFVIKSLHEDIDKLKAAVPESTVVIEKFVRIHLIKVSDHFP